MTTWWMGKSSRDLGSRGAGWAGRRRYGSKRAALRALAVVGIAFAGFAVVSAVALYIILNGLTNPVHFDSLAKVVPGTRVNVLVMGLDAPLDSHLRAIPEFDIHKASGSRTDTMMLVSIDTKAEEVGILSLPRDTRTIIAGREDHGYDKLGHAHAYGGPDMAVATISRLLSVPIHYYVRVNSAGAAKIIDTLGGVEIYVEKNMYYNDPFQDLHINLKQGLQTLDGDQAVQYLRYRSDGSDITRIERQQKFIAALKDQLFSVGTIVKLPSLLGQVSDCIDTNMTAADMLSYARIASKLDGVTIKPGVLAGDIATVEDPGREPLSYWVLRPEETAEVVDQVIWGVDPQMNATISVEVQNGTTMTGLGERFADELRRQGYSVVAVINADRQDYRSTEVIDRSRDDDKLRRMSQAVLRYVPDAQVGRARPAEDRPEFTVILGQDYATFVASGAGYGGSRP